jgi:hypothetical protein
LKLSGANAPDRIVLSPELAGVVPGELRLKSQRLWLPCAERLADVKFGKSPDASAVLVHAVPSLKRVAVAPEQDYGLRRQ